MKWFLIEDTQKAGSPQNHRYIIDAEFMVIDGDTVNFYSAPNAQYPTRVVKLAPGQIVFQANKKQADQIEQQMAANEAGPKAVVQ